MNWKVVAAAAAAVGGLTAGCGTSEASGAAPKPTATAKPSAVAQAYQPDTGEAGAACELLPSAAINALFGPLQPFYDGDVNNVSLTDGNDINGNPYCAMEWYTGTGASAAWQVTVGAVQPSSDADDSLALYLSDYHTTKLADGVAGEVYGQGKSDSSAAGATVATVPLGGDSYLYVSGTIGSTPLSAADMTRMLRVMVAMAAKYPIKGLRGIGSLP